MSEIQKTPRLWYQKKRYIFPLIAVILLVVLIAATPKSSTDVAKQNAETKTAVQDTNKALTELSKTVQETTKPEIKDNTPAEYISALAQAKTYSDSLHLSKKGIYDQLVSDYGGKFKIVAAQYAIDNLKADYNANALAQAKTYQSQLKLSPAAIKDQLISDYGAKFTVSEADYAVANLNK